jgi:hypothetical protein
MTPKQVILSTFLTKDSLNLPAVSLVLCGLALFTGSWAAVGGFTASAALFGWLAAVQEHQRKRDVELLSAATRLTKLEEATRDLDRLRSDLARITNRPTPR